MTGIRLRRMVIAKNIVILRIVHSEQDLNHSVIDAGMVDTSS